MSGRIRTIKPELLEDAVTAGISDGAFRLYVGAIVLADDYGNFRAEPRKLAGEVFWARPDIDTDDVNVLLGELALAGREAEHTGLFHLYRVRGQVYGHIRNWSKHQKVDRPGSPRCPGPELQEGEWFPPILNSSRDPRESVARLSPNPREGLATDPDHDPDHDHDQRTSVSPPPDSRESGLFESAQSTPTVAPPALSLTPPSSQPADSDTKPEREVFEYWLAGWRSVVRGVRAPLLDNKRRGKVRARLREGYSVADLKRAVDGLWASAWHIENKRYDLELVCRDASHVDDFMSKAPDPEAQPTEDPKREYGPPAVGAELERYQREFAEAVAMYEDPVNPLLAGLIPGRP